MSKWTEPFSINENLKTPSLIGQSKRDFQGSNSKEAYKQMSIYEADFILWIPNKEFIKKLERITWKAYDSFLITRSNKTPFSRGILPSLSSLPHSPASKALRTIA